MAVDAVGDVFFADFYSDIMRVDAVTGQLTVVVGNGTPGFSGDDGLATNAQLNQPAGIAVDLAGNLYIADTLNNRIRISHHHQQQQWRDRYHRGRRHDGRDEYAARDRGRRLR